MQKAEEVEKLKQTEPIQRRLKDRNLNHPSLNFCLPHEFGGLGDPVDKCYEYMNTFPDTMDLPVIKPRTTLQNKNEFNIVINKPDKKEADMTLFPKLILKEAEIK